MWSTAWPPCCWRWPCWWSGTTSALARAGATPARKAGYFPLRVGAVLGICAIAVFVQALRSRSQEQFASWLQLKRVAQVLLPLTAYIAVIAPLGIYAASVLFITGFMVFAGRYPWWKAVALSGFTSVLLFYVFEIQFKVPLPKGPLEAWLGY